MDPLSLLWLFLILILHTPGGLVIAARQIAAALANHDGRHGEVPVMTRSGLSAKSFAQSGDFFGCCSPESRDYPYEVVHMPCGNYSRDGHVAAR